MYNILYCFISHRSVLDQDIEKWYSVCNHFNITDYLIIVGNNQKSYIDNHILYLDCDDSYEGLPDKIHKTFQFIIENNIRYSFYAKIDRYVKITKPIDSDIFLSDYCGSAVQIKEGFTGLRNWHFGKCSIDSEWNHKLYSGDFIPWCRGGKGYFLSYKAAEIVACNPPDLSYHIYEDLYVAETLLYKGNIKPKNLNRLGYYLVDLGNNT